MKESRIWSGLVVLGVTFCAMTAFAGEGSLSGTVNLSGDAPEVKVMQMTKDQEVCGKERKPDTLILKGKNVANAVVTIKGVTGGKKLDVPAKNIEFVQKGCQFQPHVLIVPVGASLDILNKDPLTHNIHTFPKENTPINKAQPKTLPKVTSPKFEFPEIVKVQCDIHRGLMSAFFVVADSPYTAVSDADGKFKIAGIPPGEYEVEIWHELLGKQTQKVTIADAKEAKLDVAMAKK
jgi:plastocyanin